MMAEKTLLETQSPFKFLNSFNRNEIKSFLGRTDEIDQLYHLVKRKNILLVFGESGVGKTSLVLCGLANRFQSADWFDVLVVRKDNINDSLRTALLEKPGMESFKNLSTVKLVEKLYVEYFKPIYLIFDQLEELYVAGNDVERKDFYETINNILASENKCFNIILILREEFHAKLIEFERQVAPLFSSGFKVERMKTTEAELVVNQTLQQNSQLITSKPDISTIAQKIVEACIRDGAVNLLQLQVFLFGLWREATKLSSQQVAFSPELVEIVKQKEDPLNEYVRETVEDVAKEKEGILYAFLNLFVSQQGTKIPVDISNIDSIGVSEEQIISWANKMVEKSILRRLGEKHYELLHDSLAPVIKQFETKVERPRLLTPTIHDNPFKGLLSFGDIKEDVDKFFGRSQVSRDLLGRIKDKKLVAIVGPSGSGKSSVIRAGMFPFLREQGFGIIAVKPGIHPLEVLNRIKQRLQRIEETKVIIYIDQFEELNTQSQSQEESLNFINFINEILEKKYFTEKEIRIILSIRNDYEEQFDKHFRIWRQSKFNIPPFSEKDIREIIVEPAYRAGFTYRPFYLVDVLVNEVMQSNGALPLLSYTLSQMYEKYNESGRDDGYLTEEDYNEIGGLTDGLTKQATKIFEESTVAEQKTITNVILRMVSLGIGSKAGKRVFEYDLEYEDPKENKRVQKILELFIQRRLIVKGVEDELVYYEPAHDSLVRAWDLVEVWINEYGNEISFLQSSLTNAIKEYKDYQKLWDADPRLDSLASILKSEQNWLNKKEVQFVINSIQLRDAKTIALQKEQDEKIKLIEEKLSEQEQKNRLASALQEEQEIKLLEERAKSKRKTIFVTIVTFVSILALGLGFSAYFNYLQAKTAEEEAKESYNNVLVKNKENQLLTTQLKKSLLETRQKERLAKEERDKAKQAEKWAIEKGKEIKHLNVALQKAYHVAKISEKDAKVSAKKAITELNRANDLAKNVKDSSRKIDSLYQNLLAKQKQNLTQLITLSKAIGKTDPLQNYRITQFAYIQNQDNNEAIARYDSLRYTSNYFALESVEGDYSSLSANAEYLFTTSSSRHKAYLYQPVFDFDEKLRDTLKLRDSISLETDYLTSYFSSDGAYIIFTYPDKIEIRNTAALKVIQHSILIKGTTFTKFSPDNQYVLIGTKGGNLYVSTSIRESNISLRPLPALLNSGSATFSEDSKRIIASEDGVLKIFDVYTFEIIKQIKSKDKSSIAYLSPKGNYFIARKEEEDYLYNSFGDERKKISSFKKGWDEISGAIFSSDGNRILIAYSYLSKNEQQQQQQEQTSRSTETSIGVFDIDFKSFFDLNTDFSSLPIEIDPDNLIFDKDRLIYYRGRYATVVDLHSSQLILSGHSADINSISVGKSTNFIITSSKDGTTKLWCYRTPMDLENEGLIQGLSKKEIENLGVNPESLKYTRSIDRDAIRSEIETERVTRYVDKIILHHTFIPDSKDYHGGKTIEIMAEFDVERGYTAPGWHYMVSPEGLIWTGRPLNITPASVSNQNTGTVSVEMVLNGDIELPTEEQKKSLGVLLSALCKKFVIAPKNNFKVGSGFHNDYLLNGELKTCPGKLITKEMVLNWIDLYGK